MDDMKLEYWNYQKEIKGGELSAAEKDSYERQLGEELKKFGVIRKQIREKQTGIKPYFYAGIRLRKETQRKNGDLTNLLITVK